MRQALLQFTASLAALLTLAVLVGYAVTIPTVPIGNPGNPADTRYDPNGTGSVPYSFRMGKFEVTNAQYVDFLNAVDPSGVNTLGLYSTFMTIDARGGIIRNVAAADGAKYEIKTGRANNPVSWVTWYDSLRFVNWLHNGQGSGDTETGAYTLLGGTPTPTNSDSITRNRGARWWLPNEDEWYKAAYHKNDGVTANYWDYPTSSDTVPYSAKPPGTDAPNPSNTANIYKNEGFANGYDDGFAVTGSAVVQNVNYLTDVGAYRFSIGPYGTFDQAGNVSEKIETYFGPAHRLIKGGNWNFLALPTSSHASNRSLGVADGESGAGGFRVATVIPEPSALLLAVFGLLAVFARRRRLAAP